MTRLGDHLAAVVCHAPIIGAYLRHRHREQVRLWVCAVRSVNPPRPIRWLPLIDPDVDLIVQARPTAADMPSVGAERCPTSAPTGYHHQQQHGGPR